MKEGCFMQKYVITKIDNNYYLFDVTIKWLVMTVAVGTFQHCFAYYCKYAEIEMKEFGYPRSNYRLHIRKL